MRPAARSGDTTARPGCAPRMFVVTMLLHARNVRSVRTSLFAAWTFLSSDYNQAIVGPGACSHSQGIGNSARADCM